MTLVQQIQERLVLPPLELSPEQELQNLIRDHLSGTPRRVTREAMWLLVKKSVQVKPAVFDQVWQELVDEGYLVSKDGTSYRWEM